MGKNKVTKKRIRPTEWIINLFTNFRWKMWAVYCLALFIVGAFINAYINHTFKFFVLHQLLLIAATTMLVAAMKSFFKDIRLFGDSEQNTSEISLSGNLLSKCPEMLGFYRSRYLSKQRSYWPYLAAIVVSVFFFTCIALLEYISLDIVGIYALYIAGSSVLIGVYAYVQYLFFLWFIHGIEKRTDKGIDFNRYVPANTAWVIQIAKTSQRLRNYFLFIGLIYVIEYSILIPINQIHFTDESIVLNMSSNASFIISWIALFVLVIIAFPVINHVQRKLVSSLVSTLKAKTITDLSVEMQEEKLGSKTKKERLTSVMTYSVLIENVQKSDTYPIKRQLSYETIMTLVTFLVHVMNLYTKIASIPQITLS